MYLFTCRKLGAEALQQLVPVQAVRHHRGVQVPQVRRSVHVEDGSGDVVSPVICAHVPRHGHALVSPPSGSRR